MAFNHIVAQLLFLSNMAKRGIKMTMYFKTSKVKIGQMEKISRALNYLNETTNLKLKITDDSSGIINGLLMHHTPEARIIRETLKQL